MKIILLFCCMLTFLTGSSQSTETTVEQYCDIISSRVSASKVIIEVDYGNEKRNWKSNRLKEDGKLKKFNSDIDAINYMGKNGWKLVNTYTIANVSGAVVHYILKKEFFASQAD